MRSIKGERYNPYIAITAFTLSATPLYLFASPIDPSVTLSFLLVSGLLFPALIIHSSRNNHAMICAIVFTYLFMIIAPTAQLSKNPSTLINTLPFDSSAAIYANIIISLFIATLFFSYQKIKIPKHQDDAIQKYPSSNRHYRVLFTLAFAIALYAASASLTGNPSTSSPQEATIAEDLIKTKFLYTLPFVAFAATLIRTKSSNKKISLITLITLILLLLTVIATKNPGLEKRNALGPIYLTILAISFPWVLRTGKSFFFFVMGVALLAFPLSSLITHNSGDDKNIELSPESITSTIMNHFTELHYDAWANTVATIDYVKTNGHSLGEQALGTIFFYIPRSIWAEKPISSGELIGIHLTQNYRMWFDNLSTPIMAEGFIDFGILGVILYAIIFSATTRLTQSLINSKNPFKITAGLYLTFSVFFIMRGSLMIAFSYVLAALCAIIVVPKLISLIPLKSNSRNIFKINKG